MWIMDSIRAVTAKAQQDWQIPWFWGVVMWFFGGRVGEEGRERLRQSTDWGRVVSWVVVVSLRSVLAVLSGGCFRRGREYGDGGREDQSMGSIVSAGTGAGHSGD